MTRPDRKILLDGSTHDVSVEKIQKKTYNLNSGINFKSNVL